MSPNLTQQAARGVSWNTVSAIIVTVVQLLQYVVVARILGPEALGLMAMLLLVIGFGQIFSDAGISDAIIHKQSDDADTLATLYWVNLLAASVVALAIYFLTPLVSWLFSEPRLISLVGLIAIAVPVAALGRQFQVLHQKEMNFSRIAQIEIISVLLGFLTTIGLAINTGGPIALVLGYLALVGCRSILLIGSSPAIWLPLRRFKLRSIRDHLQFGGWQLGEQSVNFLAQRTDQLIIGSVLGAQALGYYNLAQYMVTLPASKINPVFTQVALPMMAKLQADKNSLRQVYLDLMKILAMINFPVLIGLVVVAEPLVLLAFGETWLVMVPLVQLLGLSGLSRAMANPSGALLRATGMIKLSLYWNLIVFLIQIPVVYLIAREFGLTAVAICLLALQMLYFLPYHSRVIRPVIGSTGVDYCANITPAMLVSIVMGLVTSMVLWTTVSFGPAVSLAVTVVTGVAVQFLLMYRLQRDDLNRLKQLLAESRAT